MTEQDKKELNSLVTSKYMKKLIIGAIIVCIVVYSTIALFVKIVEHIGEYY
jgi:hypothetical protein